MEKLEGRLDMSRETSVVDSAHRLYKLALEKNFTRGRRIAHVCSCACDHEMAKGTVPGVVLRE